MKETNEQRVLIADFLIKNFPWLEGEDDYPSGADQVETLAILYEQYKTKPKAPKFMKDGRMKCPACGKTAEPTLQEEGYIVTHRLNSIRVERGKLLAIDAKGWPGDSGSVSESGDRLVLMCGAGSCDATFDISDVEVNWK